MLRIFKILFPCFVLLCTAQSYAQQLKCSEDKEIKITTKLLAESHDYRLFQKSMDVIMKNPALATCYLINNLHTVNALKILPTGVGFELKQYKSTFDVIWSIRALRYITGLDFKARTKYRFKEWEESRGALLCNCVFEEITGKEELPFFKNWMSRNITFLAPKDTQREIIKKWIAWYSKNGEKHKYILSGEHSFVYF